MHDLSLMDKYEYSAGECLHTVIFNTTGESESAQLKWSGVNLNSS